jgi:long-subunit acyl-CoA synthetase (AMP-forming)
MVAGRTKYPQRMAAPATDPNHPTDRPGLGPWRREPPPDGFVTFPDEAVAGTLAARFAEMVEAHGERTALRGPAGAWSYAELGEVVRGRAGALQALVDPSEATPVCLLMTHDAPLVATIVSVIAAGHIVVVLDPVAPAEQNLHVLAETGSPLLLHDGAQADAANALADAAGRPLQVFDVDALEVAEPTEVERGPADPIMLAFTSGTSGSPKGGIITNAVLMNLVRGATNALGITAEDRMPMLFPTSMAVAAYPMFLPLLNGGTLATLDVRSVGLAPWPTSWPTSASPSPTWPRWWSDSWSTPWRAVSSPTCA